MSDTSSSPGLSRRNFLVLAAGTFLLACEGRGFPSREPRIGLALGGGGAKGLAHIPVLETLDSMGVKPHAIAGTSIGAVIGALYASGQSGVAIRAMVDQFFVDRQKPEQQILPLPKSFRWLDFLDPTMDSGGLLNSDDFIAFLGDQMPVRRFRDLKVPLKIMTADLWTGEPVVIQSGELLAAVQASIALPGLFPPVEIRGRTLVDGGVANPLPYNLLFDECDIVIAVDVSGARTSDGKKELSFAGVLMHSFQIMSENILAGMLAQRRPDILIKPDIRDVRVLEFYKAEEIFTAAKPAARTLESQLTMALRNFGSRPGCSRTEAV
jgi:NTE family protein